MRALTARAAALVALAALAACDGDATAPGVDDALLNDDVALLAADAVQEDLAVMNTVFPLGGAGVPSASSVLDYTRSRTVTYFDADGNEQSAYDALTTAAIHTVLEVSGDVTRDGFEAAVERKRDMWVTGLEGEESERTWNGTGSDEKSRARVLASGDTRTYDLAGTLTVTDVVRGVPRIDNPWPLSGTITRNLTIEVVDPVHGDRTVEREVIITFNGTQVVTMTVNGEAYEVDLAETGRQKVRRRHGSHGSTS